MAKIFKTKKLENEFNELVYKIIPSLNKRGNCDILKCGYHFKFSFDCSGCKLNKCKNCKMFKITKDLLFEKCNNEQWRYVVNFIHDLFKVSEFSFNFLTDLQPTSKKVIKKKKKKVFLEYV